MGICEDPACWRGKLLLCFGGTVNRMDVVSYWFVGITLKLLTDVRKGWKPKESPFAKETIPGQALCLVSGSELTWVSVSFSLDFSGLWRKPLIRNQTRTELGPALGMFELSGGSGLEAGNTTSI